MSEHKHIGLAHYYGVFAALMVLLVVTILLARVHLGNSNTAVAMAVATVKAVLVMTYFMHLRYAGGLTWLFAVSGGAFLVLLFAGTFNDYLSRDWFTGRLGNVPAPSVTSESLESTAAQALEHNTPAAETRNRAGDHPKH
jgi:cytochrome c oxidase subunit 4